MPTWLVPTLKWGGVVLAIIAAVAILYVRFIAAASMARAKTQGKHVGRPRIPPQREAAIRRDLLAGRSLRSTIKAHGVGSKTVQRIKAELVDETSAVQG